MDIIERGYARGSLDKPNPLQHLVIGSYFGWETWCGGGNAVTIEHLDEAIPYSRRCPRCGRLARADLAKRTLTPVEVEVLNEYLGYLT